MILRRLTQSLKEQNWTAIWIEFILLVAGVLLAMQVNNWNQQRITDQQAAIYTKHLREDLRIEAWQLTSLNRYYDEVLANANRPLEDLEGSASLSNEAFLVAAFRATQYWDLVQNRGTYDELVSTGNIGLISDSRLRRMAIETYGTKLYENVRTEGINSQYRTTFRMLVPVKVQTVIGKLCGDRTTRINDYESLKVVLDYPCSTGLSQRDIDSAASTLRADRTLAPLLRLRIANIHSAVGTTVISDDVMNDLRAFSAGKP